MSLQILIDNYIPLAVYYCHLQTVGFIHRLSPVFTRGIAQLIRTSRTKGMKFMNEKNCTTINEKKTCKGLLAGILIAVTAIGITASLLHHHLEKEV